MFKAGEHMDSDNDRARFTIRDLEDIVSCYDPRVHEAPLIIGHEQNDSTPALGWVREVWRKGRSLWGKIELTPRAERIISEGTFKKVSSSFYAPEAETNPNRGKLSLRHLALVSIPAVKGLADFREPISDTITLNFSEQRSQTLFKELLESNTKHMPRQRTRKKSISDHGEGTVNLTINVSAGEGNKKIPIYDDSGSLLNESGAPADYDMDFVEDEDKEGLPPTTEDDGDMPDQAPTDPGADPEADPMAEETPVPPDSPEAEGEMPEQVPDAEDEEMPGDEGDEDAESPTEDVSDELEDEDGDSKIAELASNYSAAELVKALAMKKQNTDLMESEASGGDTTDFAEGDAEDKDEDSEDDEDETKDYACGDEDKKEFPFNKKKKEDSEEEDSDDKKEYSEEEKDKKDDTDEDKKEYAEDDSEVSKLKDRLAALEEELQKQRKSAREKEISDFCESIYTNGKLIESVVPKKELVKFMSTLNGKNTINFSESNRKSQFDFFSEVLTNLPQVVNFSEVATPATAPKKKKLSTRDDLSGFAYDTKSLDLHAEALDFAEANNVDYVTALKTVVSKQSKLYKFILIRINFSSHLV